MLAMQLHGCGSPHVPDPSGKGLGPSRGLTARGQAPFCFQHGRVTGPAIEEVNHSLLTIKRPFVEACVLNGLRDHLMDPACTELFCREYARHLNGARMQRSAARQGSRSELDRVNRDLDRLVQALLDGAPARTVKDRMAELEARKAELEAVLAEAVEEPVLLHPNMAEVYRAKVARLVEALNDEHDRIEAAEIIRGLIDRIVLTPKEECRQTLSIGLEGALAGILALATNDKRPLRDSGLCGAVTTLVAGAYNHRQFALPPIPV